LGLQIYLLERDPWTSFLTFPKLARAMSYAGVLARLSVRLSGGHMLKHPAAKGCTDDGTLAIVPILLNCYIRPASSVRLVYLR
jgi:hypothetical protein